MPRCKRAMWSRLLQAVSVMWRQYLVLLHRGEQGAGASQPACWRGEVESVNSGLDHLYKPSSAVETGVLEYTSH